ncbi:ubiquinol oxidase, mitochondrial-like isoform X2 [Manihot esculenta]|uniref:ubiquinol oxidase, mitochondrial-like isoform X2 n=1 Tax=Manihot esculenta TaxID=3983 RepID=UPI001CC3411F|nr:ubiquinol oxidase, mitochondrial-like isoform X2 [Manihot esculenta]
MNHLVFSSVVRGLLNSGSDSRYISTATAATTADILKPTEIWTELRSRNGSLFGVFYWRRMMSTSAETNLTEKDAKQAEMEAESVKTINDAVISSYWGISRPKILREDGTEWPWNCFMPWETYQSNTSIDLTKHHVPKTFLDKFAYRTVKLLRVLKRYGCHAMM